MLRSLTLVCTLTGGLFLLGCETTKEGPASQPAMGAMNDNCPISGRPIDANAPTVKHDGKTIGFCCPACPDRWKSKSEAEKDAFVAAQKH